MSPSPRRADSGITLIEALFALMLFVVLVLGLGYGTIAARRATVTEQDVAVATTLARDKVEQLRLLPRTAAELAAGNHNDPANPLRANGTSGGAYTRSWEVVSGIPRAGLRRVRVSVAWRSPAGNRTVTLVGYVHPS